MTTRSDGEDRLDVLAASHHEARIPTRSAPSDRRLNRLCIQAAAHDQPRNQRVRVPHLAYTKFIAAPNRCGHLGNQIQQALRLTWIVGQLLRTCDRIGGIGDNAIAPAAYLVTKDPQAPCQTASDRALCNDASLSSIVVTNRCLLDHEPP